jgi:class 3 adenylate cyclase
MLSGPSDIVPPEERRPMNELRPIADLFPHTTVMFADIAGFTRWSSDRDPAHVFTLLQTVYHAFDRIAKKRAVFKVETIGDCYVAVTGLVRTHIEIGEIGVSFSHVLA